MNYVVSWRFNDKVHTAAFESYCQAISYYSQLEALKMKPSIHFSERIIMEQQQPKLKLLTASEIKWN